MTPIIGTFGLEISVPWIGKRLLMIGRKSNRRIKLRGALIDVEKESTREVQSLLLRILSLYW